MLFVMLSNMLALCIYTLGEGFAITSSLRTTALMDRNKFSIFGSCYFQHRNGGGSVKRKMQTLKLDNLETIKKYYIIYH